MTQRASASASHIAYLTSFLCIVWFGVGDIQERSSSRISYLYSHTWQTLVPMIIISQHFELLRVTMLLTRKLSGRIAETAFLRCVQSDTCWLGTSASAWFWRVSPAIALAGHQRRSPRSRLRGIRCCKPDKGRTRNMGIDTLSLARACLARTRSDTTTPGEKQDAYPKQLDPGA